MTAHDDAKIAEILGYSAEVCEPDSKPITAYYTSRHLVPVRHRLVEYVESVRADERERIVRDGLLMTCTCGCAERDAHAEAVAARLVEVICRMDEEAEWYTPGSLEQARHQRDAARAEAERLRELAKTNFDLFAEAKREQRETAQERDLARAERDYTQKVADDLGDQIVRLTAAGHEADADGVFPSDLTEALPELDAAIARGGDNE